MAAKAQFRASNHFLTVNIPSLIQSLEVWLEGSQQTTVTMVPASCVADMEEVGDFGRLFSNLRR